MSLRLNYITSRDPYLSLSYLILIFALLLPRVLTEPDLLGNIYNYPDIYIFLYLMILSLKIDV
jgi:hypothetical protein